MDKIFLLKKLEQEIVDNKNLPLKSNLVFGEGNPDCEVIFIGEAPGVRSQGFCSKWVLTFSNKHHQNNKT